MDADVAVLMVDITVEGEGGGWGHSHGPGNRKNKGRNISDLTKIKPRIATLEGGDDPEDAEEVNKAY